LLAAALDFPVMPGPLSQLGHQGSQLLAGAPFPPAWIFIAVEGGALLGKHEMRAFADGPELDRSRRHGR